MFIRVMAASNGTYLYRNSRGGFNLSTRCPSLNQSIPFDLEPSTSCSVTIDHQDWQAPWLSKVDAHGSVHPNSSHAKQCYSGAHWHDSFGASPYFSMDGRTGCIFFFSYGSPGSSIPDRQECVRIESTSMPVPKLW